MSEGRDEEDEWLDEGQYWDYGESHTSEELYGWGSSSQKELSDYTYPDPEREPELYTSQLPILLGKYIEYLDNRMAAGQDFQEALGETPIPAHAFEDHIQRVRDRTLDFETALRMVTFINATDMSAREFARMSGYSWFRKMLGMENSVTHPTPGNAKERRFDFEARRFVRQFADEAIRTGHEHGTHWKFIGEHPDREFDGGGETTTIDSDAIKEEATMLACDLVFPHWKCGRRDYEHLCQLLYMGMVDTSADQGPRRFQRNTGKGTAATRFRDIIARYEESDIELAFHKSVGAIVDEIRAQDDDLFPETLRLAVDETVKDYYGEPDVNERLAEVVHGMPKSHHSPYSLKYGTITTTRDLGVPIVLGLYTITSGSEWGGETTHKDDIVYGLLNQAEHYGEPQFLVADRGYDSYGVLAEALDRDIELLTPLTKGKYQKYHCTYMAHMDIDVDVPSYVAELKEEETNWDFDPSLIKELYIPSTMSNARTAVFRTTNPWIGEDRAVDYVEQYSSRWQIESQYQVVRQEFWPDIRTHRYASRLFYFAFGCAIQNAWRLADYWTQMEMFGEYDLEERALRAGEFVDFATSYEDD